MLYEGNSASPDENGHSLRNAYVRTALNGNQPQLLENSQHPGEMKPSL